MFYLKRVEILRAVEDMPTESADREDGIKSWDLETLYITDCGETARRLMDRGLAVLAWLREDNWEEDFGGCQFACESIEELEMRYLDRVYRRYRKIPWDILETERCLVRETTVEDVDAFYRIYGDPSITKYMEPLYEDPEEEYAYARDYIDQAYGFYHFGIWTVLEKASGEVVGRAGICYREGFAEPELGFVIAADRQGRGLATEVCGAILRYGREELGMERIHAFVQPDNAASLRVCRKLGMRRGESVELEGREYVLFSSEPDR